MTSPDMLRTLALVLFTAALPAAFAQQGADAPRFEVASIRSSTVDSEISVAVGMSAGVRHESASQAARRCSQ